MERIARSRFSFDLIIADPPYFLSNGGIGIRNGKPVCVDKGPWDVSHGSAADFAFTKQWLFAARNILKSDGSIWVSATMHNLFQIGMALNELGFRILDVVTWQKPDPPPILSRKLFQFSTEFLIWARKDPSISHQFNSETMRQIGDGETIRDVWTIPAVQTWEKECGRHPTQKPLALYTRIILACSHEDEWILDPFTGGCTSGVASALLGRKYFGIDKNHQFLDIGIKRFGQIQTRTEQIRFCKRIPDLVHIRYGEFVNEDPVFQKAERKRLFFK